MVSPADDVEVTEWILPGQFLFLDIGWGRKTHFGREFNRRVFFPISVLDAIPKEELIKKACKLITQQEAT